MSNKKELIDNELYQMIDAYKRHSQPLAQSLAELFDSEFISLEEFNGVVTDEDSLLDYVIESNLIIFDTKELTPHYVLYTYATITEVLYKFINFYATHVDNMEDFYELFDEMGYFEEILEDCKRSLDYNERTLDIKYTYELSPKLQDKEFIYKLMRDHYTPDEIFIGWASVGDRICVRLGNRPF